MTYYISNAFSASMLDRRIQGSTTPFVLTPAHDPFLPNEFISAVGHEQTAQLFSNLLGVRIETNRVSIHLHRGDKLLVGQYTGPRLPEGATTLPDGAAIEWWLVSESDWGKFG